MLTNPQKILLPTNSQMILVLTFLRNLKGNLHCLLLLAMHFTPRPPKLGKEGNDGIVGGGDEGDGATCNKVDISYVHQRPIPHF